MPAKSAKRITSDEYAAHWWEGFHDAIYDESDSDSNGQLDRIEAQLEGAPLTTVSKERGANALRAYKAGKTKGTQFVHLYRKGKFPELRDTILNRGVIAGGFEDAARLTGDFIADPIGFAAERVEGALGAMPDFLTVLADPDGDGQF